MSRVEQAQISNVTNPENVYNLIQHIFENGLPNAILESGYADPRDIVGEPELSKAVANYRESSRTLVEVLRALSEHPDVVAVHDQGGTEYYSYYHGENKNVGTASHPTFGDAKNHTGMRAFLEDGLATYGGYPTDGLPDQGGDYESGLPPAGPFPMDGDTKNVANYLIKYPQKSLELCKESPAVRKKVTETLAKARISAENVVAFIAPLFDTFTANETEGILKSWNPTKRSRVKMLLSDPHRSFIVYDYEENRHVGDDKFNRTSPNYAFTLRRALGAG